MWHHESGIGEVNEIDIVGDGIEAVYRVWNRG
jgi:hypothetical protein